MNSKHIYALGLATALSVCCMQTALAAADLAVTKTVDNPRPAAGSGVEFSVEITNLGPESAGDILLTDPLPAGLAVTPGMSSFVSQGAYDDTSGLWQVGELLSGRNAVMTIPAILVTPQTPACYSNIARISDSNSTDPQADNDTALAVVYAPETETCAHLQLSATPDVVTRSQCGIGPGEFTESLWLDFELHNTGPDAAENVEIKLTGNHPEFGPGYPTQPDSVFFASIPAGSTARESVGWKFKCGQNASTATYTVTATTSTTTSGSSVLVAAGQVQLPSTGSCDCSTFSGGACFIATAAYGSSLATEIKTLRRFRDNHLLTHRFGRALVRLYYEYSPPLAAFIADREWLRAVVRGLLVPLIYAITYPLIALLITLLPAALKLWMAMRRLLDF